MLREGVGVHACLLSRTAGSTPRTCHHCAHSTGSTCSSRAISASCMRTSGARSCSGESVYTSVRACSAENTTPRSIMDCREWWVVQTGQLEHVSV